MTYNIIILVSRSLKCHLTMRAGERLLFIINFCNTQIAMYYTCALPTVPEWLGQSQNLAPCPGRGLPNLIAMSQNPARLHEWECGSKINLVY